MKERPILFSAPMIRALLAGTKTMTRRIVKPQQPKTSSCEPYELELTERDGSVTCYTTQQFIERQSPYGVGDRLWVRETWAAQHAFDSFKPSEINGDAHWHYAATEERGGLLWRPSIFMPRWASRITLEVTGVRVERLQDITEEDARVEGIAEHAPGLWGAEPYSLFTSARRAFEALWRQINGADSWAANQWVWVVEFRRVEAQERAA